MSTPLSRRDVIRTAPLLPLTLSPAVAWGRRPDVPKSDGNAVTQASSLPQLDPALARAVVGEAHRSFDNVKELLTAHPEAAKASIDWGFGDWESALGAASHTGRREIALLLIEHGARPDLFTFAMLGHTPVLKALVEAMPGIQRLLGPHGIPLAQHARAGGDDARDAYEYLISLGDADTGHPGTPATPDDRAACAGEYVCTTGEKFTISDEKERLRITFEGRSPLWLVHQGDHTYHPVGAPSVRVRFTLQNGSVTGLTIRDGELLAEATRA